MTSNQSEIEQLAYALWESRGRPDGSSDEDWLNAERTVRARAEAVNQASASQHANRPASASSKAEEASQDSFPASDAPASHLPDRPPSNAGAKWAASAAAKTPGGGKPSGAKR